MTNGSIYLAVMLIVTYIIVLFLSLFFARTEGFAGITGIASRPSPSYVPCFNYSQISCKAKTDPEEAYYAGKMNKLMPYKDLKISMCYYVKDDQPCKTAVYGMNWHSAGSKSRIANVDIPGFNQDKELCVYTGVATLCPLAA